MKTVGFGFVRPRANPLLASIAITTICNRLAILLVRVILAADALSLISIAIVLGEVIITEDLCGHGPFPAEIEAASDTLSASQSLIVNYRVLFVDVERGLTRHLVCRRCNAEQRNENGCNLFHFQLL